MEEENCFIGLDVGREDMEAVWINEEGERMGSLTFLNNHEGYDQFIKKLKELEEQDFKPVIGVEGHAGDVSPLDGYLWQEGFLLFSIHPLRINRHKDILGQPQKTDNYDAYVIADFLHSREHQLENMPQFKARVQGVKKLSRTHQDLKKQKNRYISQLRQALSEYFPELLQEEEFPNLDSKTTLFLLRNYPSLKDLREVGEGELTEFLREESRGHYGKETAQKILDTVHSIKRSPVAERACVVRIKTLAELLCTIRDRCQEIKKEIGKLLKDWEDARIVESLGGAGDIVTGRLLGEIGTVDRFHSSDALGLYCGTAPIPYSSGKWKSNRSTQRVNKRAKDAIMQLARCSQRCNKASREYYQKKRAEGKDHWHAIKCLARNLIRVIYAMLRDRTYYQPEKSESSSDVKPKENERLVPAT